MAILSKSYLLLIYQSSHYYKFITILINSIILSKMTLTRNDLWLQLLKTRRLLELLLEGLPCEYDPWDYYETSDQLLEPLLLCYESLVGSCFMWNCHRIKNNELHTWNAFFSQQSSDAGVLADGRLSDLIRRVATFGMVLMKLDLRQVRIFPSSLGSLSLIPL